MARVLATMCLAVATGAAAEDVRPGETDPINNPKKLTLFPVSTVGLLASQNSSLYSDLFDYAAADAQLKQWTVSAQKLQAGDTCQQSQRRRLGHGRVSTPEFEQAVCMTNFGLTVYTSPLKINDGSRATLSFPSPSTSTAGRNFDLAIGELVRRPSQDEQPRQAVVAAYANLQNRLQIDVIIWVPEAGQPPKAGAQGRLEVAASYVGPADEAPTGDVAVALGDFMNDGTLQIISAADATASPGPGRVRLAAYRYASDGGTHTLQRVGSAYAYDIAEGRPSSLALAAADFTGRGHEQFIMSYLVPRDASTQQMALVYFDPATLDRIGPAKDKAVVGPVAANTYADIATGLFKFDPKATASVRDPFFRRQLAIAYVAPDSRVLGSVLQVSDGDPPRLQMGPTAQFSAQKMPAATPALGPLIAAGNFIGFKNDGVDPRHQIAVALPGRGQQPGRIVPDLVVARVNNETMAIDPVYSHRMPNYEASGLVFGVPIVAYDRGGDSLYLGNPAHITIQDMIDPQYVVGMPPRHVDALPVPSGEQPYTIVNLLGMSGPSSFNVTLRDSADNTLTETSTNASSARFGSGTTQTVGSTVGGGFMNIANFEASLSVRAGVSYETNSMERNLNSAYQSVTTQKAATTTQDDHLVFNMRLLDIWRYPVYGVNQKRSDRFPFYDIVIPGQMMEYSGGGLNYDWYNPSHQNYNAISYPEIPAQGLFATDIGKFSYRNEAGKQVEVAGKPLNSPIARAFDGNAQSFSLDYTTESGSSSEKSFSYSLSRSLDITTGFRASADVRMFSGSANYEGTVSLSDTSSWESSVVSQRTMRNSRGITLEQPDVTGIASMAYHYQTLIYVTGNGGIKVAHGTDFLRSSGGARWWKSTYGGRPDPALNLPWRMAYDPMQGAWTLAPEDAYFRLRGLKITEALPDAVTGEYAPLLGGVDAGTKVRLVVPVHNNSLDTAAQKVVVAFAYHARAADADRLAHGKRVKPGEETFVEFARSKPITIAPRAIANVEALWDTSRLGGSDAGIAYDIQVTVDPDDTIPDKLHGSDPAAGAQTIGRWPWNGGFWVFNASAATAADAAGKRRAPQAPRLALRQPPPAAVAAGRGRAAADTVTVTIDMPVADRSLRRVVISGVDAAGKHIALASRSLYGLGPGQHQFDIALGAPDALAGLSSVNAWLSSGALRGEPHGGIGAALVGAAGPEAKQSRPAQKEK
ncbi:MAG: hypothetical protein RR704_08085 [Stenotrophomonas sp.]